MNLFAKDTQIIIPASLADKGKNYLCLECNQPVRLREGPLRQAHFYHLHQPKAYCRQHQKSKEHLNLQLKLLYSLGQDNARMECPFPEINRIADVACPMRKWIFEIQCSPISLKEVMDRQADYTQIGYRLIWILHDKRFNKRHLTASEKFLRETPCFFSNMNAQGEGMIYDQFEILNNYRRLFKGPKLPLSLESIALKEYPSHFFNSKTSIPTALQMRYEKWKIYAKGDLFDQLKNENFKSASFKHMLQLEKKYLIKKKVKLKSPSLKKILKKYYQLLLNHLFFKSSF